jgi:hypothetical protein
MADEMSRCQRIAVGAPPRPRTENHGAQKGSNYSTWVNGDQIGAQFMTRVAKKK